MVIKILRDLHTVFRARKWLMPIVNENMAEFVCQVRNESSMVLQYKGSMPQHLKDAWEITLTKWYLLFMVFVGAHDGRCNTCGLCWYCAKPGFDCLGCPIARGGHPFCEKTPYIAYNNNQTRWNALAELAI